MRYSIKLFLLLVIAFFTTFFSVPKVSAVDSICSITNSDICQKAAGIWNPQVSRCYPAAKKYLVPTDPGTPLSSINYGIDRACGVGSNVNPVCSFNNADACNSNGGAFCGGVQYQSKLYNITRCFPKGASVSCADGYDPSYINAQIDYSCGISSTQPTKPSTPPVPSNPSAPSGPSVGLCDGCGDIGTCRLKGGTFNNVSTTFHPECIPNGGYCSGTTVCGGGSTAPSNPSVGYLSCGEKCTSNSQCRNPSANGAGVACVNGTCQNTMCPAGQTVPGANCDCGANNRKCGQSCSGAVGLCGAGQGTCTYVNPPKHWYTGQPDCAWGSTAYCSGSQNGYKQTTCITGDAPGGKYLVAPSGATTGITVEQIQASCQVCGNGTVEVGEVCDDGAQTGNTATCACTKSCQYFSGGLTANGSQTPISLASGSSVTLAWQTAGMTSCTATGGWTGSKAVAGNEVVSNVTTNTQFNLSCTQAGTNRQVILSANVNIAGKTAAPTIDFRINKSNDPLVIADPVNWATQFGVFNTRFSWTTTGATSCAGQTLPSPQSVYPFPGGVPYASTAATAGWFLFDKTQPVSMTSSGAAVSVINDAGASKYGVFILTCTGAGGTTSRAITVSIDKPTSRAVCGQPVATPAPTPAPVCQLGVRYTSTGDASKWKIGDLITFTTDAIPTSSIPAGFTLRYEGQVQVYRGTTQVKNISLTPINATASQFQPMAVQAVNATYYYRFRYCAKNITGSETCSAWGSWASPSGN